MSIRWKIVLIVVPLILATLLLTGVSSYFSASNGITRVAKDFLGFKAQELQNQAESQWRLLVDNNLTGRPEMVNATQAAVEGYAKSIVRSATELILAVGEDGVVRMSTSAVAWQGEEQKAVAALAKRRSTDLLTVSIGGKARVAKGFWFEPFQWYLLVTEERASFYDQVNQIAVRTVIILVGAIVGGVALVLIFAGYLTRPLTRVVGTMKEIISTNDLSKRVVVEYHDEIGALAQTFNLMTEALEQAYQGIKRFAFEAVLAQREEKRTQTLFGKYVPENVLHEHFANPEEELVGENRVLAVLFSDIRSFTTISEGMKPADLVYSLNRYFEKMVAPILERKGIVDNYIGDAIKAFFGASVDPARKENYALAAVQCRTGDDRAPGFFQRGAGAAGHPEFRNGLGIHYGVVTIGNIGTEKKKEYTVIGETVELAEHLEGLTKEYKQPLLMSESLYLKVKDDVPCRLLDSIPWREGRGLKIYTARGALTEREKEAWDSAQPRNGRVLREELLQGGRVLPRRAEDPPQGHCGGDASRALLALCQDTSAVGLGGRCRSGRPHEHPLEDRPHRRAPDRGHPASDGCLLVLLRLQRDHARGQGLPGVQGAGAAEPGREPVAASGGQQPHRAGRDGQRHAGGGGGVREEHRPKRHGADPCGGRGRGGADEHLGGGLAGGGAEGGGGPCQEAQHGPVDGEHRGQGAGGQGVLVRAVPVVPAGHRGEGVVLRPGEPDRGEDGDHPGGGDCRWGGAGADFCGVPDAAADACCRAR